MSCQKASLYFHGCELLTKTLPEFPLRAFRQTITPRNKQVFIFSFLQLSSSSKSFGCSRLIAMHSAGNLYVA